MYVQAAPPNFSGEDTVSPAAISGASEAIDSLAVPDIRHRKYDKSMFAIISILRTRLFYSLFGWLRLNNFQLNTLGGVSHDDVFVSQKNNRLARRRGLYQVLSFNRSGGIAVDPFDVRTSLEVRISDLACTRAVAVCVFTFIILKDPFAFREHSAACRWSSIDLAGKFINMINCVSGPFLLFRAPARVCCLDEQILADSQRIRARVIVFTNNITGLNSRVSGGF